jgi:hypothetical protein
MSPPAHHARPRRAALAKLCLVALTLLAAPTAGDIGSCGQEVVELDAVKFFREKQFIDCQKCRECDLSSKSCVAACNVALLVEDSFPEHCFPLVHDGEVCLNALRSSSCDDYVGFMDDVAPSVPTECNFCPVGGTAP